MDDSQYQHQAGNNTLSALVNSLLSRVDKLEDKITKIELMNQKYMQRNFELTQELLKAKDSQKLLEKLFFMFLSNMNPSSQDVIVNSLFPQYGRKMSIEPPPIAPVVIDQDKVDLSIDEEPKIMRSKKKNGSSMIDILSSESRSVIRNDEVSDRRAVDADPHAATKVEDEATLEAGKNPNYQNKQ